MGDVNAGDIKAKVSVEYDGSGVAEAKQDISSLSDIVGGSLAESTGRANDALSSLDEQMGKNAESTTSLVSSVGALPKTLQASSESVTTVTEVLGEHQTALEDAGAAYVELQKPIEGTTALLEQASPPMLAITQHAESMQEQMSGVNDGFVQIGESLAQSVPLLPQFASSLHSVSEEFDPHELDSFNENLAVFQDALQNPYPFQLINQHLNETGQTWDDFSSSIGDENAAFLDQMAAMPVASEKAFGSMSSDVQGVGQTFYAAAGETEAFNKQWSDMAENIDGINKSGGVGTALYGPQESWDNLDEGMIKAQDFMGAMESMNTTDAMLPSLGDMFSGLHQIAMPLMAVQMIGMAIGQVSQGIYNMAALAEGPAAHSVGSFTGAVDQLGHSAQSAGESFSEGFGQGIKPMLDAMNNVSSQGGSGNNFLSGVGTFLGGTANVLGDLAQMVGGGVIGGLAKIVTLNGAWGGDANQIGDNWFQNGWQGLQNTWADITGSPEPYPTPGASGSQIQIDLPTIQSSLAQSIAMMNAQANSPGYLAAQTYLQSQGAYAAEGQASYNDSHMNVSGPGGSYSNSALYYAPQAYQNAVGQEIVANGGTLPGLSDVDLNRLYFDTMASKLPPLPTFTQDGGCFPAGTPVLLADGSTKAIETLCIGDHVLAHDGTKQVTTTILALITPPPKQVYELCLDDGGALTLTDSHPISTTQGWKSLSPAHTKEENPDLVVTVLQIGDCIHVLTGVCTLVAIEPREIVQVYNITVADPHTFYANGVLVHNKFLGTQIMQNVANSDVPSMDMKNTNLIQSMMGNFTDADLTHTFTAVVNWATTGDLSHSFIGNAVWSAVGDLVHTFIGNASWDAVGDLVHTFEGVASWVSSGGLQHTFEGIASWVASGGLQHTFEGLANWIGQGLSNLFTGKADWVGQDLEHTFTAVANWVTQEVTQVTGSIPGFASGVEGFAGGLAVVGEHGPELAYLPQGTSIYPHADNFTSLFSAMGSSPMGNNAPSGSGDLHMHVQVGSKEIAHEILPDLAPMLRRYFGVRQ